MKGSTVEAQGAKDVHVLLPFPQKGRGCAHSPRGALAGLGGGGACAVAAAQGLFAKGAVVAQLRGGRGWAQGAWGGWVCGWGFAVEARGCEKKGDPVFPPKKGG